MNIGRFILNLEVFYMPKHKHEEKEETIEEEDLDEDEDFDEEED